jgi:hypothetical protein
MKQGNYGREARRVEIKDAEQARILLDPKSFRFFGPFLARDCTASQAASELHCHVDTMIYRIKTFLRAGLLKVVKTQSRRGRSMKVYRSSAEAYFLPFGVTAYQDIEAQWRQEFETSNDIVIKALANVLRQLGREGKHIFRDELGEVSTSSGAHVREALLDLDNIEAVRKMIYDPKSVMAEATSDTLLLSDKASREFMLELYQLWRRYKTRKPTQNPKKYFMQLSFVPMDE